MHVAGSTNIEAQCHNEPLEDVASLKARESAQSQLTTKVIRLVMVGGLVWAGSSCKAVCPNGRTVRMGGRAQQCGPNFDQERGTSDP